MAMTEPSRTETAGAAAGAPLLPGPDAFRAGDSEEDRLVAQLAFAMAAERGLAASPETVESLRTQAAATLSAFAFRYLHNRVEEIRREAVAAQLGRIGRPPGFLRLVLANLAALAIAAVAGGWIALYPETLSGLLGR